MRFRIVIKHDRKNIRLNVERVYKSAQIERFDVVAANRTLTIQSNRPLLKAKRLRRRPDYKLIAGAVHNLHILEQIIEAIHERSKEFTD